MSRFEKRGQEVGKLVDEKNESYGDSFGRAGEVMRVLYPDGISPGQYDDALAVIRIIDKLFRVATHGKLDPMGESAFVDIAGYALLGAARHEAEK